MRVLLLLPLCFYALDMDKDQHRCKAVKENQIAILLTFLRNRHRQRCSVSAEYETRSTVGMRREQILLFSSLSVSLNVHVLQYRIRMITSRREIPTFCIQLYAVVAPDLCWLRALIGLNHPWWLPKHRQTKIWRTITGKIVNDVKEGKGELSAWNKPAGTRPQSKTPCRPILVVT